MRLDGSIIKYTYDPTWQGKTVYFKFQPVNNFGNNPVPLSSLSSVAFTIGDTNSGAIDASTGLVTTGAPDLGGLIGKWWRPTSGIPSGGGDLTGVAPFYTTKDSPLNY